MGTPEFPDLGKHCAVQDCKIIDFLPFTCDRCRQVFCLEHRSYIEHSCPKPNKDDVTVVICPLCAKGVRLNPDEDPNITWETHVNTECDPTNYEKVNHKKKCPIHGCREVLTFSNTIKCRECLVDHCLKHRFVTDHKCTGPRKPESSFPFLGLLSLSRNEEPKHKQKPKPKPNQPATTTSWATSFFSGASNLRASAEAGVAKLSNEIGQAWLGQSSSSSSSSSGSGNRNGVLTEECPQCGSKFSSVSSLVDHVEKVHERRIGKRASTKKAVTIDVCPKCSKGFRDPVALVEHVERDHGGTSKA